MLNAECFAKIKGKMPITLVLGHSSWLCLTSVEILFTKDCNSGLELRAWSLEIEFATQSSKLKALSNEKLKPEE